MFCTLKLNPSHRCHSSCHYRHLYFLVTVYGAIADSVMKKILEFTYIDSRQFSKTAGVITKEGYENGARARPTGRMLIWQISALTAILQLYNSSGESFPILLSDLSKISGNNRFRQITVDKSVDFLNSWQRNLKCHRKILK